MNWIIKRDYFGGGEKAEGEKTSFTSTFNGLIGKKGKNQGAHRRLIAKTAGLRLG